VIESPRKIATAPAKQAIRRRPGRYRRAADAYPAVRTAAATSSTQAVGQVHGDGATTLQGYGRTGYPDHERGRSSMVELQPSKLAVRVRFPSPASWIARLPRRRNEPAKRNLTIGAPY
jgi:hypothetical protein